MTFLQRIYIGILRNISAQGNTGHYKWHPRVPRNPVGNHWSKVATAIVG